MCRCSVYVSEDSAVIVTEQETMEGAFIGVEPFFKVAPQPEEIAKAIMESLKVKNDEKISYENYSSDDFCKKLCSLAGCRKWSDLIKKAKNISVGLEKQSITMSLGRRKGGGFAYFKQDIREGEYTQSSIAILVEELLQV